MSVQLWELQTRVQRVSLAACRNIMLCVTAASIQVMLIIFRHCDHLICHFLLTHPFPSKFCWIKPSEAAQWQEQSVNMKDSHHNLMLNVLQENFCDFAQSSPHSVWTQIVFLSYCLPLCLTHCLPHPILLPLSVHHPLLPSLISSQRLPLDHATFPLRGFLCFLGCQVNSGMSGSI